MGVITWDGSASTDFGTAANWDKYATSHKDLPGVITTTVAAV